MKLGLSLEVECDFRNSNDRVMAQEVSPRPPNEEAPAQTRASLCGICGAPRGTSISTVSAFPEISNTRRAIYAIKHEGRPIRHPAVPSMLALYADNS